MPLLQELVQAQQNQIRIQGNNQQMVGLPDGRAYAQYFPTWEVTAPQYQVPVAWSLAQLGYRTNEVAYACIGLKMRAISEPPIKIYSKKTDEEVVIDEFFRFMEEPCPELSETDFWTATEMYLNIAGVLAWEKDFANDGSLLHVWPMMPQYCSYMRGEGQLLRAIRYQPYTGLPFYDVDRKNVVLFMLPDPQYFGLKPMSPTAIMGDIIGVDNDMTVLIQSFLKNGTFADGLLKTDQIITEADARFARERWQEGHGGPQHAGQIAVLGKGLEFQRSSTTFREMVFPEVDARSETRICMGYSVPPILIAAKSGMDRATYSNYEQARAAWYEEWVPSEWKFIAERMTRDLLPHFTDDKDLECRFDTMKVKALIGIREKQQRWTVEQAKANIITRDEARVDLGKDKIDDQPVFVGVTTQQQLQQVQDVFEVGGGDDNVNQGDQTAFAVNEQQKQEALQLQKQKLEQNKTDEKKKFLAFSKRRIKEGKYTDIGEYEFLHHTEAERKSLIDEVLASAILHQLETTLGENYNGES